MYSEDAIYQILLKYRFHLCRNDSSVPDYLSEHFHQYTSDIAIAAAGYNPFLGESFCNSVIEQLSFINEKCAQIIEVLEIHRNGYIKDANEKAFNLFDSLSSYYLPRFSWSGNEGYFYRIRKGDFRIKDGEDSKRKKSELFHIKNDDRHLIAAYRYSVSGFPCLYLTSGFELSWFECGMPHQFSYCKMRTDANGLDALKLIDFSNRPVDLLSNVTCWLSNNESNIVKKQKIYNYLLNYIITYPLCAACSIRVKNRGEKYVEEYVLPQLFMHWIRETGKFDGVRYKSSLNSSLVDGIGAINIALPVKEFRKDGLCKILTSKIEMSDIGYFDVQKAFSVYANKLKIVDDFKNELLGRKISLIFFAEYEIYLVDICETICVTYELLMSGNYERIDVVFHNIDCLFDQIQMINKSKEFIVKQAIDEAKSMSVRLSDDEIEKMVTKDIDDFYKITRDVVHKHMAFHFNHDDVSGWEKI